jgi:WD40 repeat protein
VIFDLLRDFDEALASMPREHPRYRILKLLDEAARRDVHFIDRHATTLFQCLWNTCWWYDCREAEKHYQRPASDWPSAGPSWRQSEPLLSSLLTSWRGRKESDVPGFRWLRSLRPPQVRLDAGQQFVLRGHEDWVNDLAYSPDGRFLATGSRDGTVHIWDAVTLAELLCLKVHAYGVWELAFSPDGRRLACGGSAGELCVLDTASGVVRLTLVGHTQIVTSVCYSPDGRRIASVSWDGTARLWEASDGSEVIRFEGPRINIAHLERLHCGCFNPDGRLFAAGTNKATLLVWDVSTGAELLRIREHDSAINGVCFSPDGQRVATASTDSTVRVWDARTGAELLRLEGHSGDVLGLAFSPDGLRLASASKDSTIRVWDAGSGSVLFQLQGHTNWATCVRFSPDGHRIASGSWDKTARVWNASAAGESVELIGHSHPVGSLCFSPDGRHLASASYNRAQVWNVSGECAPIWSKELTANIGRLLFSPDGERLACGAADGTVRVWDASAGTELGGLQGLDGVVRKISFSPDGQRLAIAALSSKAVLLWSLAGASAVHNSGLLSLRERWTLNTEICFTTDGQYVVSASDNSICISNASSGNLVRRLPGDFGVRDLRLSPDGKRLAAACMYNAENFTVRETVQIWDVESGAELVRVGGFEQKQQLEFLQFSSDGRRLAGSIRSSKVKMLNESYGHLVQVWDAVTGARLESFEEISDPDLYSFANGRETVPWRPFRIGAETVLEENGTRRAAAFFPDAPPRDASGRFGASSKAAVWAWNVDNYIYVIALEGDRLPPAEEEARPRTAAASMGPVDLDSHPPPGPPSSAAPTDHEGLIDQVEAMLADDQVAKASALLRAAGRSSPELANALGVCYLRSGQVDLAALTFQPLVFRGSQRRHDVPTIYATNLATAMILQGNVAGGENLLKNLGDDSHPAVRRLREVLQRGKARLSFRDRLRGLFGFDRPLEPGFRPGDFR